MTLAQFHYSDLWSIDARSGSVRNSEVPKRELCIMDFHLYEQPGTGTVARTGLLAAVTFLIYALAAVPAMRSATVAQAGTGAPAVVVLFATLFLGAILVALSTIDALTFQLPDVLTLPLVAAGVSWHGMDGWQPAAVQLAEAIIAFGGLAFISWAYLAWRGRAGMGLGDAKLLAGAVAWLGLSALPAVLLFATSAALVTVALAAIRKGRVTLTDRLPFGPFLAVAIWLVWLYGAPVGGLD